MRVDRFIDAGPRLGRRMIMDAEFPPHLAQELTDAYRELGVRPPL
ncbi:MAG: hypothetical protein ACRDRG_20735 [Pseudonocardiaceae bacterium]